jgi:predicted lipoprotein with Yx(FWY)xxD motif
VVAKAPVAIVIVVGIFLGLVFAYFYASPLMGTSSTTTGSSSSSGVQYTVNIAYKAGIGNYLTNGTGFALYYLSTDMPYTNSSTCTSSACMANWPVFYVANLVLPPGLSAGNFSVFTNSNGAKQLTFDGYPLYYWIQDTKPGDVTGNGVANFYAAAIGSPPFTSTSTTTTTSTTSTKSSSISSYGY